MLITWFGHSSFLLEDSDGRRLLTDPFDDSIGYEVFKDSVDIATISHQHFDHNYKNNLDTEKTKIVEKVGLFNVCDIPIEGIPSFHDNAQGAKRGENIIYIFQMDDLRICHLGDLGHVLSKEEGENIGSVDILFIPIGGNYTLNGKEAYELTKVIKSNIIIPMHYKTPDLSFPLDGLEDFIRYMKKAKRVNSNFFSISKKDITNFNGDVILLDYK